MCVCGCVYVYKSETEICFLLYFIQVRRVSRLHSLALSPSHLNTNTPRISIPTYTTPPPPPNRLPILSYLILPTTRPSHDFGPPAGVDEATKISFVSASVSEMPPALASETWACAMRSSMCGWADGSGARPYRATTITPRIPLSALKARATFPRVVKLRMERGWLVDCLLSSTRGLGVLGWVDKWV